MILKIAGIVILALLGLALAVLLLVLFVPVRYRACGSYYGKARGTVKITWLLHALSLKITYEDGVDVALRVLGKRVFQAKQGAGRTGDRPEEEDGIKAAGEKSRESEEPAEAGMAVNFVESAQEEPEPGRAAAQEARREDIWTGRQENRKKAGRFEGEEEWLQGSFEEPAEEEGNLKDDFEGPTGDGGSRKGDFEESGDDGGSRKGDFEESGDDEGSRKSDLKEPGDGEESLESDLEKSADKEEQQDFDGEGAAGFGKAGNPRDGKKSGARKDQEGKGRGRRNKERKSRQRKDKGRNKDKKNRRKKAASGSAGFGPVEKLRRLKESAASTWSRLAGYKDKAISFWNDGRNQKTIRVILRQAKAVLCHILPGRVQGKAVFGFEDPAATGKVLSALSVAYAWYGDSLEIIPVFDRSVLEVEGSLKGRVRAGTIAARCFRVLLDKNFRRLAWGFFKNGGK